MNEPFIYNIESEELIMKMKKQLAVYVPAVIGLMMFTGCSRGGALQLANELTFPLDNVSEVTISYDEEAVTFYKGEKDCLVLKEYMTENKRSYYAKTELRNGTVKVSEGGKPFFKAGFQRSVEVYLPESYCGGLTATTTDGDIDLSEPDIDVNALRIDSTAGMIHLGTAKARNIYLSATSGTIDAACLKADAVRIDTTSGSFFCEKLEGDVAYTTTSGSAEILSAVGSGSYRANNSGELQVIYTEVTGDLSFYNKNDGISLTLPADLEFDFKATTKNGTVSTPFPEKLSSDGRTTSGTIGRHPVATVTLETNNGAIEVRQ